MAVPHSGLTLNNVRRFLTRNFEEAGLDAPAMEARILVGYATGLEPSDLIARGTEFMSADSYRAVSEYAAQRLAGKPVSQIIGYRDFWKDRFSVNAHVLTPRPETEGVIEVALTCFARRAPDAILDLGTGSGAIILSLLGEFAVATGVGTDISPEALSVARGNSMALSRSCAFIQSHWFEDVSGRFDLIVSNPPYITDAAMQGLPRDVAEYEPRLALCGGPDGLKPYRHICQKVTDYLSPDGWMIFEVGYDQGAAVSDLLRGAGLVNVDITSDLQGHDRIVFGQWRG